MHGSPWKSSGFKAKRWTHQLENKMIALKFNSKLFSSRQFYSRFESKSKRGEKSFLVHLNNGLWHSFFQIAIELAQQANKSRPVSRQAGEIYGKSTICAWFSWKCASTFPARRALTIIPLNHCLGNFHDSRDFSLNVEMNFHQLLKRLFSQSRTTSIGYGEISFASWNIYEFHWLKWRLFSRGFPLNLWFYFSYSKLNIHFIM